MLIRCAHGILVRVIMYGVLPRCNSGVALKSRKMHIARAIAAVETAECSKLMVSNAVSLASAAASAATEAAAFWREENAMLKSLLEEQIRLQLDEDPWRTQPCTNTIQVVVKSNRRSQRLKERERGQKCLQKVHVDSKLAKATEVDAEMLVREAKKRRLLTAKEEVKLVEGFQEFLVIEKAKSDLMKKMQREPSLQEWAEASGIDERYLRKKMWIGSMCRDKLVTCNLGLVATIAKHYMDFGLPMDDLMQEGCLGLLRGIEKFDPSKGFRLSTYVYWWIKQAIGRAVALKAKTIRLPVRYYELLSRIKQARRTLFERHGRPAEDTEVADAVGVSVSRMHGIVQRSGYIKSFDRPLHHDSEDTLQEIVADDSIENCENVIRQTWLTEDVNRSLKCLKPQEEDVLRQRYGLNGSRAKTLEEIGSMYNVTRERIRQIEVRAMRKLKCSEVKQLLRLHLVS